MKSHWNVVLWENMLEKIGVAFYYKDLTQYPAAWVNKCVESILAQTHKNFEIYILDYGEKPSLFPLAFFNRNPAWLPFDFLHKPLLNYAAAMNEIYQRIFRDCDVAVNTNIDDYYATNRIELLTESLRSGADIATSNYHIVDENNNITASLDYAKKDVALQFKQGGNPVSNPCTLIKKRVFEKMQFNPALVPIEDLDFWIRALDFGFKIVIRPEYLHFYRMHKGQETRRQNPL